MRSSVTLRDLASHANVSPATVSRVLNQVPGCSDRVTEKVKKAVNDLGYRPDPGVAALARRRRGSGVGRYPVAFLKESSKPLEEKHRVLYDSLKKAFDRKGYSLNLESIEKHGGPASTSRVLLNRGVVGCICMSLNREQVVRQFEWGRFCVVALHQENFVLPFDTVRPDLFSALFDAFRRARDSGAGKIGLVLPSSIVARENEMLLSAAAYHMQHLPESPPPLILRPGAQESWDHYPQETADWYEKYQPEVIIGKTDGTYWYLQKHGVRIPEDCRFISLQISNSTERVSGYIWPMQKLAESIVERLHSLFSVGDLGARETPGVWSLPCTWKASETF